MNAKTPEEPTPPRVRRISTRRNAGFSFSSNSASHSTTAEGGVDLNSEVEAEAVAPATAVPPRPGTTLPPVDSPVGDNYTPRDRLRAVGGRSSDYEREYRLSLLHRLLMRNVPLDEIAAQLELSVSQVMRDRQELYKRLREEARKLDIELIVGDSKGFYDEVTAMSMRAASQNTLPMAMRLAAMRTALAARNDSHRFMQAAGVYDALRYQIAPEGKGMSDIERMMAMTSRLLDGDPDSEPGFSSNSDSGDDEEVTL